MYASISTRCLHWWRGAGAEVNKFEQVSTDDPQMSLAGRCPCTVRYHVWRGLGRGPCTVRSNSPWVMVRWEPPWTECQTDKTEKINFPQLINIEIVCDDSCCLVPLHQNNPLSRYVSDIANLHLKVPLQSVLTGPNSESKQISLETINQFSENNSLTFTEVVELGVEEVSVLLAPLGALVRHLDPTLLLPLPVVPGRRILLRVVLVSVAQRPVLNLHQDRCVYHVRLEHGDRVSSLVRV